jgi:energy-coupling factor transport system ATP-binding protein
LSEPIIEADHLCHTYQSGRLQRAALVDVSLQIARGSCVAVIGVTGSGKSTLVQHFNGLLRPTAGRVCIDGIDTRAAHADLPALRRRVGMLFQFPEAQLFGRTVFEDVAFGPRRLGLDRGQVETRVAAALETAGLPASNYAERSPFALSGGQMRRVALAGMLAMAPSVLILDEPTVGLDAAGRADFYDALECARRSRNATVVLVTHDMAEVAALADWLVVLHASRLVLQGPPRAVFAQADRLDEWGLAAPPLAELLALLRRQGLTVPQEIATLDEAFAFLREACQLPRMG